MLQILESASIHMKNVEFRNMKGSAINFQNVDKKQNIVIQDNEKAVEFLNTALFNLPELNIKCENVIFNSNHIDISVSDKVNHFQQFLN